MGNHYLEGNFAPVGEEVTATELPVTGSLPPELVGRLVRIGPNPVTPPDPARYHWFTGTGMVHGVRLEEGRAAWYRNRYVGCEAVSAALGRPAVPGPRHGMSDVVNTHVIGHAGRTLALVEAGALPVELTDELETVGRTDFDGTLPGGFTAHTKRCPDSGELHAVTYYWAWDHVKHVVVGVDGRVRRVAEVPVAGGPMIHDCALTESSVLVFDLPVAFDLEEAMSGQVSLPYHWDDTRPARIGILPREGAGTDVVWCEVEPCFVFHPLNAYDLPDGRVVVDVVRHPSMFVSDRLGPNEGPPTLDRWTLDPASGRVKEERLDDRAQEFPRHDERLVGKRHRYGYTVGFEPAGAGPAFTVLVRHDLERGTAESWSAGEGRSPMEAVFVPASDGAAEDDGWLLAYVHDETTGTADVIVKRADDFAGDPVATVHLPARVPYGFHGSWLPDPAG